MYKLKTKKRKEHKNEKKNGKFDLICNHQVDVISLTYF